MFALKRPLIWLDVETHDKVPPEQARICDLGFKVFYHDGREPYEWEHLINPVLRISPGAEAVHHITNEMVANQPKFAELAPRLAKGFADCDYAGYNVRFDLRVLTGEFARTGVNWSCKGAHIVDPLRILQIARPRTLSDAIREHLGREPRDAHRALGDALDAADLGAHFLDLFADVLKTREPEGIHKLCFPDMIDLEGKFRWDGDEPIITFGKHNGKSLRLLTRIDPGYLKFIIGADFSAEVKAIAQDALVGVFPQR